MADTTALNQALDRVRNRKPSDATPMQLSIWPERVRALPNSLARCALFTCAGKKEPRTLFKRQQIVSVAGAEISYTGEELRQDDQDVWLQVVHIARQHPLGDQVEIHAHALIRALGWNRSSVSYVRLRACIMRMTESTVWITQGGLNPWSGRLIEGTRMRGEDAAGDGMWSLKLDRKTVALFAPDGVSLVEWELRLKLKPLAKWLHSFYSTHREPFFYKVATLHQLCGSKASRLSHFRAALLASFDELLEVGFLSDWKHDPHQDTIAVVRRAYAPALTAA